jgi:hypothetical protein
VSERRGEGVWLLVFLALVFFAKFPAQAEPAQPKSGQSSPAALQHEPPSAPARGVLGDRTIYRLARWAGWTPEQAVVATAIAIAESRGRPRAHNPVPPDDSYGLWQINMLGRLGPERRVRFHLARNSDLYQPATNARAAWLISGHGSSWQPWTTFTRGTYLSYQPRAKAAGRG